MQVTVRSYLMAGLAAAGAGALAIAPLPAMTPQDVKVPTVEAPVTLAVQPSLTDLVALGIADSSTLAAAGFASGANGNTFLSGDTSFLGASFAALSKAVAADPQTYGPLAAAQVAFLPTSLIDIAEPQITGVSSSSAGVTQPGQASPVAPILLASPPYVALEPTVVAPINTATTTVSKHLDNVSAAFGGPKVAEKITTSSQAVGTSVVQAQGLVRSAVVGTAQTATLAAIQNNPQGVANAIQSGPANVQKAILGDSTATKGTVKNLGAIGTVSSTVQKAASDISKAVTNTK
jgi:hypothetical protein